MKSVVPKMTMAAIYIGFHCHPIRVLLNHEGAKTAIALMKQAIHDRPSATPSQVILTCMLKIVFSEFMTGSGDPKIT